MLIIDNRRSFFKIPSHYTFVHIRLAICICIFIIICLCKSLLCLLYSFISLWLLCQISLIDYLQIGFSQSLLNYIYFSSQPIVLLKKESVKLWFFGIPNETELVFWNVVANIPVCVYGITDIFVFIVSWLQLDALFLMPLVFS